MGAGGPPGWPAGQAGRWIGLDSLCRILSSLSGANIGHQNSLRPSALDKEQRRRVEEGTVSKLNSVLLAALRRPTCGGSGSTSLSPPPRRRNHMDPRYVIRRHST